MTPARSEATKRPLVIAIGNRYRRDDGVAAAVLDALAASPDPPAADLLELDGEPTRVVDAWAQRSSVVLVDAVSDSGREAGEVVLMQASDAAAVAGRHSMVSGHSAGLAEAMALGEVLERMPAQLTLVGVVGSDFGEGPGLSPAARGAVDTAVAGVRDVLAESQTPTEVSRVPR